MAFDPYAPCPCGSGKKLKWCCLPILDEIQEAIGLYQNQQEEAAFAKLDALAEKYPQNPEILARKADLLVELGRFDEAEAVLSKLEENNPKYAYGYFLRGSIRFEEGEYSGALLLFRKAAEIAEPADVAHL